MACAGNRPWSSSIRIGSLITIAAIGFIQTAAGIGIQPIPGDGHLSITGAGSDTRTWDGVGFPDMSGRLRGLAGGIMIITAAGPLCLRELFSQQEYAYHFLDITQGTARTSVCGRTITISWPGTIFTIGNFPRLVYLPARKNGYLPAPPFQLASPGTIKR